MQNQETAHDAFDGMFGDSMQQLGNLGIRKNRNVSEGSWELDRRTLQMQPNKNDLDQRHGLYVDGKLVKTYNTRSEAENVKVRDAKFRDAEIKKITEANRNQDRNWEDEAEQEMAPDKNSPYYVFWTGQSHEWYGDGGPESGYGRYKPKGEAGGIVAINIKDRDTAEKLADDLNTRAEDGSFPDKSIYNKWNKDYYLVDYMGAEARSMKKMDDFDQRMLRHDLRDGKVKDYANQDMSEAGMSGINRCAPSSNVSYEKVLDEVSQKWKTQKNIVPESKITSVVDYILSEQSPCWKNYKQIGMKVKGGKKVPNCVPVSEHEVTLEGDAFIGIYEDSLLEAEYHGHKVQLGKPMQGDVKKFKVYVKDPSTGNIKKVNFGDPDMRIRKSNPKARKSFRARHHCENPGPHTSARYWSCRAW